MKKSKTSAATNGNRNLLPQSRLDDSPKQREAHETAKRLHRNEVEKQIISQIEVVHEYNIQSLGRFGFGFRKSDGHLVGFNIPPTRLMNDLYDTTYFCETTLAEALEWIEHMDYSDRYFGDPMQTGPAYSKWIVALRQALLAVN
jgi:hypothetical protein